MKRAGAGYELVLLRSERLRHGVVKTLLHEVAHAVLGHIGPPCTRMQSTLAKAATERPLVPVSEREEAAAWDWAERELPRWIQGWEGIH